ncbi:hypothetical protein H4S08_000871 [Coemansia sp. RSA 1365]|nr:hypothetical protein H4S08_000871 [Coemansia sp. RSA 1365]
MFQRVRSNSITPLESQKHVAKDGDGATEEALNRRVEGEVDQLLNSFGEIIQSSRIYSSNSDSKRGGRQKNSAYVGDESDDSDDSDSGARGKADAPKDKYTAAQEAYSVQTRAATMVRSVESLLNMVADVKRAYLVNDTSTLVAMADRRRRVLEEHIGRTRAEVEALNSALDTAVRELETVYYNTKYAR